MKKRVSKFNGLQEFFILAIISISFLLLIGFVSGTLTILLPADSTNVSGVIVLNLTFNNNTDAGGTAGCDGCLMINLSNTWLQMGENVSWHFMNGSTNTGIGLYNITVAAGTTCINLNGTSVYCNATWDTSNIDDFPLVTGADGGNITAIVYNGSTGRGSLVVTGDVGSLNSTFIKIDNTVPIANKFNSNLTTTIPWGNYTGNTTLNISVTDVNGISSVIFTVSNSSGLNHTNYSALREGTSNFFVASINTSNFPDGRYNVSVYVNDSLGNINSSTIIHDIAFDSNGPDVSLGCSPDPVNEGETITCTCTVTDSGSGANSTATQNSENPSTTSTGDFTVECTGTDYSKNSRTANYVYTVSGSSQSGGSSSSSSGGSSITPPAQKTTRTLGKITPEVPEVVKNFDSNLGIKEITINVKNEAQNVKITVNKFDSKPSQVTVEKTGKVERYFEIDAPNLEDKLSSATISVDVPKSWVTENELKIQDVFVFKLVGSEWTELPTTFKEETDTGYIFDATVDSFSFFAVGSANVEPEDIPSSDEPTPSAGGETGASKSSTSGMIIVIIIAIVLIVALVWFFMKRKK